MKKRNNFIDNNLENLYLGLGGKDEKYLKVPLDSVGYVAVGMGLDKVEKPLADTTTAVCVEFVRDILADIYSVWEFENSIVPIS